MAKHIVWSWKSTSQIIQYIIINILFSAALLLILHDTKNDKPTQNTIIIDVLSTLGFIALLIYQYLGKWYMGIICISVTLIISIFVLIQDLNKYIHT